VVSGLTFGIVCVNVGECILLVLGLAFLDRTGHSVFPLSPLSILWVNMVTSSPPAFGLGMEPPAARVMKRPPHDIKKGVFTIQIIIDILYYGLVMGITVMISFVVVMWGRYGGDLGTECNRADPDGDCVYVFRARSTVFATLVLEILLFAWELKALDRSVFNITPGRPFYKDLWANKILFWTVVLGCASIPLAIYIPVLNSRVFYQAPISTLYRSLPLLIQPADTYSSMGVGRCRWHDYSLHGCRRALQGLHSFQAVVREPGSRERPHSVGRLERHRRCWF